MSIYFRRVRGVNYGVGGKCEIVVGSGLAYPRPIASVNSESVNHPRGGARGADGVGIAVINRRAGADSLRRSEVELA